MMKRILALATIALLTNVNSIFAQQEAMYTQYMFNTLAVNPAYAGSRNVISATALLRKQWSGMDGAPKTSTFTIDAPIHNKKVGLGLQLFKDKVGIVSNSGAVATYAYRIRMAEASLAFGIQGSLSQHRADYTSVMLTEDGVGDDPAFSNNVNKTFLNFGAGVYYNSDKFYVGLSSPQLMPNVLPSYNNNTSQSKLNRQYFHLFLMSGYVVSLSEDFALKPSVLVKAVQGAPIEGDFNANLWIKNAFSIGAQYRTNANISGLVEIQATPQIRFGYAYDHSITNIKRYSHEIMLRYEFGLERNKVLTPRYF